MVLRLAVVAAVAALMLLFAVPDRADVADARLVDATALDREG